MKRLPGPDTEFANQKHRTPQISGLNVLLAGNPNFPTTGPFNKRVKNPNTPRNASGFRWRQAWGSSKRSICLKGSTVAQMGLNLSDLLDFSDQISQYEAESEIIFNQYLPFDPARQYQ